jgi:nicotinate-nucleotide pyrophosphorylase (carboxylating)
MRDLNALSLPELFEELTADGSLRRLLEAARDEDLGAGDVTTRSMIEPDRRAEASIVTRDPGIVSGLAAMPALFELFDVDLSFQGEPCDGDSCREGTTIARIDGALASLLTLERTMLNLLGRLSGIATLTRRFVEAIKGTDAVICDTRKTTPGLRALEKYAVRCGGGTLHRLGLYDAALYKDNHLAHLTPDRFGDALAESIRRARADRDLRFVEVEVDTLDQLRAVLALEAGSVDFVLLDNMSLEELRAAVALRDRAATRIKVEASGGVSLQTVRDIARTGVDRISVGALTHSAASLDIGLDIVGH